MTKACPRRGVGLVYSIDDKGTIRVEDVLIETIDKPKPDKAEVRDLRNTAKLPHVDNKVGRRAALAPIKIGIDGDGSDPAFTAKKTRVENY